MMKRHNTSDSRKGYWCLYTVIFLISFLLVFSWFLIYKKTFIWHGDGWEEHYNALVYYGRYLRKIIKSLIYDHRLVIPDWDFTIGEGSDILASKHYYGVGDPFAFLAVFFPTKYMLACFMILITLRLYISGVGFSLLCFETDVKNRYGILAGAMVYVFSFWNMLNAARHPFFLNPAVFLPFVLLGIEKILRKKAPIIFIVSVFLESLCNFYFFYAVAVLTVIYVIVRLLSMYRNNVRDGIKMLFAIALYAITAVLMSGIIFVPIVKVFIGDARMGVDTHTALLYPLSYYRELPGLLISSGFPYWMCMGFSSPVVLAMIILFLRRRENATLKRLFVIAWIMVLLPFCGLLLNGFAYQSNRWSFGFALLSAYIFAAMWPALMELTRKEHAITALVLGVYSLICIVLRESAYLEIIAAIVLAFLFLEAVAIFGKRVQALAVVLTLAGIINISNGIFMEKDYIDSMIDVSWANENLEKTEAEAVKEIAKNENEETAFYRFSGQGTVSRNGGMLAGLSSTSYSGSLTNQNMVAYRNAMEMNNSQVNSYRGYDQRTALLGLASVLYYTDTENSALLPYGFQKVGDVSFTKDQSYQVYRNKYFIPMVRSYDIVVDQKQWDESDAVEKQEVLLKAAYIEKYQGNLPVASITCDTKAVDYTISPISEDTVITEDGFNITKKNAGVILKFKGLPESETYVRFKNIEYEGSTVYEKIPIKLEASNGMTKSFSYLTEYFNQSSGRKDYAINLAYSKEPVTSVKIRFSKVGNYSLDELTILCQPMEHYKMDVEKLDSTNYTELKVDQDFVSTKVDLDTEKLVCFSIPYEEGWTAWLDGEKTELYRTNLAYMSLEVPQGQHYIELKYHTPLKIAGLIASMIGFMIFLKIMKNKEY